MPAAQNSARAETGVNMAPRDLRRDSEAIWRAGVDAVRAGPLVRQARRNSSVPLVPPKPKLFFTATSMRIGRASFGQ